MTYLRLDGSVETEKRFEIVKAFNSDPTIDVLLLTTHGTLISLLRISEKDPLERVTKFNYCL